MTLVADAARLETLRRDLDPHTVVIRTGRERSLSTAVAQRVEVEVQKILAEQIGSSYRKYFA